MKSSLDSRGARFESFTARGQTNHGYVERGFSLQDTNDIQLKHSRDMFEFQNRYGMLVTKEVPNSLLRSSFIHGPSSRQS